MPRHFGRRGRDGEQAGALLRGQKRTAGGEGLGGVERLFIACLPFNAILQQGIESKNPRFNRDRQTRVQTFVCERP